jgi:hypothetical protein
VGIPTGYSVRVLAGLGLAALVGAQGACGTSDARPTVPPTTVHAERHTWGGLCAAGPCASDLVVQDDGTWTYSSSEVDETSGSLSATDLDALHAAVAATTLGDESTPAADCAADYDGTSVRYAWTLDDRSGAASTCETVVSATDPLVRYLDELADSLD